MICWRVDRISSRLSVESFRSDSSESDDSAKRVVSVLISKSSTGLRLSTSTGNTSSFRKSSVG